MKLQFLPVLLATAFALVACGGNSTSPTSQPASVVVINGIKVPPDPGAAKNATVAGVDTDHNGIRDEIDRWIATNYGNKPKALEAIRMSTKASQKLMSSHPATQAEALAVVYESMDVGGCVGPELRRNDIDSEKFFNESMFFTYNTRDRLNARKNVFNLAGMILRDVKDTTIVCPYANEE